MRRVRGRGGARVREAARACRAFTDLKLLEAPRDDTELEEARAARKAAEATAEEEARRARGRNRRSDPGASLRVWSPPPERPADEEQIPAAPPRDWRPHGAVAAQAPPHTAPLADPAALAGGSSGSGKKKKKKKR